MKQYQEGKEQDLEFTATWAGYLISFDTEQLIKYFTEKYGDGLIKDYIKDKIIKAEIAKENELIWKKLDEKINLGEKAAMKKSARIKK